MFQTKRGNYKPFFVNFWRQINSNVFSLFGVFGLIALILLSVFNSFIIPFTDIYSGNYMMPPAWSKQGDIIYILGTDHLGRDIFSRLLLGTTPSVGAALLITAGVIFISSILCLLNIFFRSSFVLLKVILNTIFIMPTLLIALVTAYLFGNHPQNIVIAVTISLVPQFYNSLNHAIQREALHEYVIAAQLDGASKWNILIHSILPNIMTQCIAYFTTLFTFALLMLATFHFLELGTTAQSHDWGSLMREYAYLIDINPAAFILPGLCLLISVLIVHFFGVSLRQTLRKG